MIRGIGLATVGIFALVPMRTADAQCPDGSPPPCRAVTVAAAPRRVNPPLDERTWIVVPFDNIANAQDIDWLRAGSVNLLYLDMSRWRDIRVVDDERVADLMRDVPGTSTTGSLSLNTALAIARRAGAGRLVMGDILKLGSRTAVTAKVFDTQTGQRVRSVREETSDPDSVMSLYGRLARRVLNLAPPRGANVGALGTTSIRAYQAYIAGVDALNRWDIDAALEHLKEAAGLDSTFALAHYKLAIAYGWGAAGSPEQEVHATAAQRWAAPLPPRERALVSALSQQTTGGPFGGGDWSKACETYASLLEIDSLDVEAWYGRGDCLFHDLFVDPVPGDTTRKRFRAGWGRSIQAFERVLQLDPTYHLAYQHVIDALTSERQGGCYQPEPGAQCRQYSAFLIRRGDTLDPQPLTMPADSAALRKQAQEYVQTRSRRRNLEHAHALATAWVQVAPDQAQARGELARVLLYQGRVAEADQQMVLVKGTLSLQAQLRKTLERMEIAFKRARAAEAIGIYDSVRSTRIEIPGAPFQFGNAIAGYGPAFGRVLEFDSLMKANMRGAPEYVATYSRLAVRAALTGIAGDSLLAAERAAYEATVSRGTLAAARMISPTLAFALRAPRTWPAIDTVVHDVKFAPAVALSIGDTAALRRAAVALDSVIGSVIASGGADSGFAVIGADAYLVLRDSVAALRIVRRSLDSAFATTPAFPPSSNQAPPVYFVPRAMLLRADLAAALGHKDEARTWYKRFVEIWATAAPELQPIVERARKSLAALDAQPSG